VGKLCSAAYGLGTLSSPIDTSWLGENKKVYPLPRMPDS